VISHLTFFGNPVIVPPQGSVNAVADFNAGVNANQVQLSLSGILIPVGNIQRL
jgi:hypothetical protein